MWWRNTGEHQVEEEGEAEYVVEEDGEHVVDEEGELAVEEKGKHVVQEEEEHVVEEDLSLVFCLGPLNLFNLTCLEFYFVLTTGIFFSGFGFASYIWVQRSFFFFF